MSYQSLEKYRDELIDNILDGKWNGFSSGQNNYIKGLSETEKRRIKELITKHTRLDKLETDNPEVFIETKMHSATGYLDDLLSHLEGDIFPLLSKTKGKAPFTVLRNILCYCDCIARLQYGKKGSSGDLEQLFENFGPYEYIQKRYREYKKYLIQLYRHDLVHTVRPWSKVMFIKASNQVSLDLVGWHIRAHLNNDTEKSSDNFSELKKLLAQESKRKNLVHLRVDRNGSHSPIINIYCFLFDLVNYTEELKTRLIGDRQIMENFMKNLIEIIVEGNFRLLKQDIPTLDLDNNKSV
jgi:hypothetical protein